MAQDERDRQELRSGRWRRSSQGHYVPAHLEVTPAQRIIEAGALLRGAGAIGGWAAAHWHGAPFFEGVDADGEQLAVLLCIGDTRLQKRPGIDLLRNSLPAADVVDVSGMPCTTPLRTTFDIARHARHLFAAVAAIDTLLECGLVNQPELAVYVERHRGWRGVAQARRAVGLAVEGVRSPPETWLRLTWTVTAALSSLLVNPPVFSRDGELLGIADLLDVDAATVIEYDGEDHLEPDQSESDRRRDERLRDHGMTVVRVTKDDMLRERGDQLISRLAAARLRGLARDRTRDRWTLASPPGWTPFD
jgi:hypothetical protein